MRNFTSGGISVFDLIDLIGSLLKIIIPVRCTDIKLCHTAKCSYVSHNCTIALNIMREWFFTGSGSWLDVLMTKIENVHGEKFLCLKFSIYFFFKAWTLYFFYFSGTFLPVWNRIQSGFPIPSQDPDPNS